MWPWPSWAGRSSELLRVETPPFRAAFICLVSQLSVLYNVVDDAIRKIARISGCDFVIHNQAGRPIKVGGIGEIPPDGRQVYSGGLDKFVEQMGN